MKLSKSLISGLWLGQYDSLTFAKGMGYPFFIAINHLTGLPLDVGEAVLRIAACGIFALAVTFVTRPFAGFVTFLALLFAPATFSAEFSRVLRESFYVSITLIFFGAASILVSRFHRVSRRKRILLAGVVGLSAAMLLLTREEGVWLFPPAAVLIGGLVVLAKRTTASVREVGLTIALCGALVVSAVTAVGLVNRAVYGRYVVNEITSSEFQGAMKALQRASYSYWEPYLPVPRAARGEIYAVSPSFAKLRPWIDPASGAVPMEFGCILRAYLHTCGDIAGGWFMWVLRAAAENAGQHRNPSQAAEFYVALTREIDAACSAGKLNCAIWLPPFVPPMLIEQVWRTPEHLGAIWSWVSQSHPVNFAPYDSVIDPRVKGATLSLLNYPRLRNVDDALTITFSGWYHDESGGWFRLAEADAAGRVEVARRPSPDLVTALQASNATHQRFLVTVKCSRDRPCGLRVMTDQGAAGEKVAGVTGLTGGLNLGAGRMHIDSAVPDPPPFVTLRTRLHEAALATMQTMRPFYTILVNTGPFAFLFVLVRAIRRRRVTPGLVIVSTLGVAIATRVGLLTLIQMSSFPVANYLYTAVAVQLAIAFAILSWALALGFEHRETVAAAHD